MSVDLHPDVVRAIRSLSQTETGRRYDRWARRTHGLSGPTLAGKTVAGEFGGRSTRSGRGVVSSAGARGPAQFIPSTRQDFIRKYGIDPWSSDRAAIQGLMLHQLERGGLRGYNPGMPSYPRYIKGQKIDPADLEALRAASPGRRSRRSGDTGFTLAGPQSTEVRLNTHTIPAQSFEEERRQARRTLLTGDINLDTLLAYKSTVNSLKDVPARRVAGDLEVRRTQGKPVRVQSRTSRSSGRRGTIQGGGEIYEVFHDPLGQYWDSGKLVKGAIGGHGGHVHLAGSPVFVRRSGKLAQQMGLNVGENSAFTGRKVTGGHAPNSFHYEDKAIDVSGDPAAMRKFARMMLREARRGRGR